MGAWQFTALDRAGRRQQGLIDADTPRQARAELRARGLIPLALDEAAGAARAAAAPRLRRGGRVVPAELALLTRQLATLVGAGTPLAAALADVAAGSPVPRIAALLMALRAQVAAGHALADALAAYPRAFPPLYCATVAAGERSGHLAPVLERLADFTEARHALRQKLGLALFYPLVLSAVATLVVVGLLSYVVPQVVQVFDGLGQELPALTRGLIALSDFLRGYGVWLLLGGGALACAGVRLARRPALRRRLHRVALRLPLFGRLLRGLEAARYARTCAILLASGVPVLDALRIAAQVVAMLPIREAVETAALRVREGVSLHRALADSGQFPPLTVQLVASGEASGRLAAMLERAALQQERETETLIAVLLGVFEPLLILTMGLAVLLIVLAILLPIFDLNQLVK